VTFGNPFAGSADRYAAGRPYHHVRTLRRMLGDHAPADALDVACGTGLGTRGLAEIGVRPVGVDVVPEMVARARADTGLPFAVAAAEALPLRDGAVDLVTVGSAIHWFDRDRFVAETARVLRPGGWLLVYEHANAHLPADPAYTEWVRTRYVVRYPPAPRGPMVATFDAGDRFALERAETWEDEVTLTLDQLVAYLLSQTNTIDRDPAEVRPWLHAELGPFFAGGSPVQFAFRAGGQLLRLVG
jgi:SAM-dependent methyltransferase